MKFNKGTAVKGGIAAIVVAVGMAVASLFGGGDTVPVECDYTITPVTSFASRVVVEVDRDEIPDAAFYSLLFRNSEIGLAAFGQTNMDNNDLGVMTASVLLNPIQDMAVVVYDVGKDIIGYGGFSSDGALTVYAKQNRVVKAAEVDITAEPEITVDDEFSIVTMKLTGVHSGGEGMQVTNLITKDGFDIKAPDTAKILYINQISAGVNGAFVLNAPLGIIAEYVNVTVGGTAISNPAKFQTYVQSPPARVTSVPDNSVRIGNDVYDLTTNAINTDRVVDSLVDGGNVAVLKIGGFWYDLIGGKIVSSDELKPFNAVDDTIVNGWQLRKWFVGGVVIDFEN